MMEKFALMIFEAVALTYFLKIITEKLVGETLYLGIAGVVFLLLFFAFIPYKGIVFFSFFYVNSLVWAFLALGFFFIHNAWRLYNKVKRGQDEPPPA